jgi:hypothetical protein
MEAPESRSAFLEALFRWLEEEREALFSSWRDKGVAPVRRVQRVLAERTFESAERSMEFKINFKHQDVEISEFRFGHNIPMLYEFESEPPGPLLLNLYAQRQLERGLPKSKPDQTFNVRLALWFGYLCAAYLSSLRSLADGDREIAQAVATEYLDYLERDEVDEVSQVAIGGIVAPAASLVTPQERATLRALTAEELGEISQGGWGMATIETTVLPSMMPLVQRDKISMEGCMLTVRRPRLKHDDENQSFEAGRLLVALELLGYGVNGRAMSGGWMEPGPRTAIVPRIPELPRFPTGPEKRISVEDLERAYTLSESIPDTSIDKPRSRADFVISRFIAASAHEDEAEAIFDYVIALEALLVPEAQSEVSYRISMHGAHYIATDSSERKAIFQDLKTLYGVRSRLAHGSGAPPKKDLYLLRLKARDLAARGIVKALRSGWPTAKDFATLILS